MTSASECIDSAYIDAEPDSTAAYDLATNMERFLLLTASYVVMASATIFLDFERVELISFFGWSTANSLRIFLSLLMVSPLICFSGFVPSSANFEGSTGVVDGKLGIWE